MLRRLTLVLILLLAVSGAHAAVETTTVSGTVYLSGGANATGGTISCTMSESGTTPDGSSTATVSGTTTATIGADGSVSIALTPNDAITPASTYYDCRVTVTSPSVSSYRERWQVDTSPDPVVLGNVTRLQVMPGRPVVYDFLERRASEDSGGCTSNELPFIALDTGNLCQCSSGTWVCAGSGSVGTDSVGVSQINDGSDTPSLGECVKVAAGLATFEYGACGTGDMTKAAYDTNADNTVDAADTAATATALASNPTDCSAGQFANAIAASGNLTCSADGSSLTGVDAATVDSIDSLSFLRSDAADTATGLLTIQNGLLLAPDTSNVTTVVAYDQDADGTLEMTDLQAIVTAYGAGLRLIVDGGNWLPPVDSSNSGGILEITNDNVHIECRSGAVLNGPRRFAGQHDGAGNAAALQDTGAFAGETLTGYTLTNVTDDSSCTVTSNTDDTVTCTLTGGTDNDWDLNDYYNLELDLLRTVYFSGTTNVSIRGCEVDHGVPDATAASLDLLGFTIQPGMAVSCIGCNRFWIQDNYLHDTTHAGIFGSESKNGIVTGNLVERAGRYGSVNGLTTSDVQNGVQFYTDGTSGGLSENILVANNRIKNYTASCIKFRRASTSETTKNHAVIGNVCINGDISVAGTTDCVDMIGVENGVVDGLVCVNAPMELTAATNWHGDANGENAQKNIRYSDIVVDNSTATVAVTDVVLGDFLEDVTISGIKVRSQGDQCMSIDPPQRSLVIENVEMYDCGDTTTQVEITNISASNHAIGATGTGPYTEDPELDYTFRNWRIVNPTSGGSVFRVMNDVPVYGWTFDGLEVVGLDAGDLMRFPFASTLTVKDLRFTDWYIEGSTTGSGVDFENTSTPVYENHRFIDMVFDGIGGYGVTYSGDGAPAGITAIGVECAGAGCDGAFNLSTATDISMLAVTCPDISGSCITAAGDPIYGAGNPNEEVIAARGYTQASRYWSNGMNGAGDGPYDNTTLVLYEQYTPNPVKFDTVSLHVQAAYSSATDCAVCIYGPAGTSGTVTKIGCEEGAGTATTLNGTGVKEFAMGSDVTVPAGTFWLGFTCDNVSGAIRSASSGTTGGHLEGCVIDEGSASVASAMPSTVDLTGESCTAANTQAPIPWLKLFDDTPAIP